MSVSLSLRTCGATLCAKLGITDYALRSAQPSWRILMYHRVVDPNEVAYPLEPGMYVRPETFAMHLRALTQNCQVVSLAELVRRLRDDETMLPGTVAITFDDGWVDNYQNAFPLLKRYGFPATIFLATGFIESDNMFWTDNVAYVLAHTSEIERAYLLNGLDPEDSPRLQQLALLLKAFNPQHPRAREMIANIIAELKALAPPIRQHLCESLRVRPLNKTRPRSFLSWAEIKEMSSSGISFDSHSHNHEIITDLSEGAMKEDITRSYQTLREHEINALRIFCYPGGYYDHRSQQILAELGIDAACLTSSPMQLNTAPPLLNRIGIHEDIASTEALFRARLWLDRVF